MVLVLAASGGIIGRNVEAQISLRWVGTAQGSVYSEPTGVSADGAVVVGVSHYQPDNPLPFVWTAATGVQTLPTLGHIFGYATAVSADGLVVVGELENGGGLDPRAFRWTAEGGMQLLPQVGDTPFSAAYGTSADGAVVVGSGFGTDPNNPILSKAFRWSTVEGMQLIEGLFVAASVSANGRTVAGGGHTWTANGGPQALPPLASAPERYLYAQAISAEGSTVVGDAISFSSGRRAFRYAAATGTQDLGTILNHDGARALGVSGDGSRVVGLGTCSCSFPERAFLWTSAGGMQNLRTVLLSYNISLDGQFFTRANAISADGLTVVGIGSGPPGGGSGWIVTLPPGPICYSNCDGSTMPPVLNINDFVCFLNKFAAGDTWANCDGSQAAPMLNITDFVCFVNAFAQGCS